MKPPAKAPPKLPPRGGPMSPPPAKPAAPLAPRPSPLPSGGPQPAAPATPAIQAPPRAAIQPPARGAMPARPGTPPLPGTPQGAARTAQIAAAGATGTVGLVIEAVRLMDGVLVEENQVLRRHDAKAAAALQERKLAATRLYNERMRMFAKEADTARTIPDPQRAELIAAAKALDEHVHENAILLKATIDSIDRLFAAINTAAQQKIKREVTYSRGGVVAPSSAAGATSVAFNRTV